MGNAFRFAAWRGGISPANASAFQAGFDAAIRTRRLVIEAVDLTEVLARAVDFSAIHTLKGGHRSCDVLLVASASVLGVKSFLTFDKNQRTLAKRVGMETPLRIP
jgi:predicted nucleic acid-binding protein